jgi:hypothetical protein
MNGDCCLSFIKNIFYSLARLRVAIAKIPPYFSPPMVNPNVSLKDYLDLAARMFPFISIIYIASMPSSADNILSEILWATPVLSSGMHFLLCNSN